MLATQRCSGPHSFKFRIQLILNNVMPPRTRRRTRQKGAKAKKSSPKTPLPVLSADRVTVVKRAQVKDAPKGVLSLDEARECAGLRVGGLDVANHFLGGLYGT